MSSLQLAAFTQGADVPSSRFRVQALAPALGEQGIATHEFAARFGSYPPPGVLPRLHWLPRAWRERAQAVRAAFTCDVALFQREMISTLATAESGWQKPAVLDVDDAIWLNQRFGSIDRMARRIGHVIAGNSYIADHFDAHARVHILPTAVDTQRYTPGDQSDRPPVMVWSGSASGLPYLAAIAPALTRVLQAMPDLRLRVVCNAPPVLPGIDAARLEYIPWRPETEVAALQTASVGLMPMPDTPWTRGKCSFKMLTYMACALPVVVSPYGMNAEVLGQAESGFGARDESAWVDALLGVLRDDQLARRMGGVGRVLTEKNYSIAVIAPQLAAILREVAAS